LREGKERAQVDVPVHVGADPAKIASSEDIITQVIPLASVDAVKLRADLAPMLNTDAVMTANTGSNSNASLITHTFLAQRNPNSD